MERAEGTEKRDDNGLQDQLDQCRQEVEEWRERYARAGADLENYRKRAAKDMAVCTVLAQSRLFGELLPIVDNFDRALAQEADGAPGELRAWCDGVRMIRESLAKLLQSHGVKEMDTYEIFDPCYHEAVAQVESDEHESGAIVEVVQKGYLFDGNVLRPAQVTVAK